MKTFSFPENSISGKYLFSGNAFTRTKRSLSPQLISHLLLMQTRLYLFPFDDLIKIFIGNVNVVNYCVILLCL